MEKPDTSEPVQLWHYCVWGTSLKSTFNKSSLPALRGRLEHTLLEAWCWLSGARHACQGPGLPSALVHTPLVPLQTGAALRLNRGCSAVCL